jgi:hypothetical protein
VQRPPLYANQVLRVRERSAVSDLLLAHFNASVVLASVVSAVPSTCCFAKAKVSSATEKGQVHSRHDVIEGLA